MGWDSDAADDRILCLDVCRCYSTHLGFVLDLVKIVTKAFFSCF